MAELIKIVAVALVTVFAHILIKQTKPEISMIISLVGSILIVIMVVDAISVITAKFFQIFRTTGVESSLLTPLFKIIAIGYIAEFGANICTDAGANSVADKILFSAKLIILIVALPIITTVIDMVVALL